LWPYWLLLKPADGLRLGSEYFEAMRPEFSDVFWGVGVGAGLPFLIYALYSQFAYPTPFVNWMAILGAVFLGGYYLWRADHVRLQPKFVITQVLAQPWTDQNNGKAAMGYYFEVVNTSETTTIRDAQVELAEITPLVENLEWLPVHLIQKHDRSEPLAKTFDLHPGQLKHIDFVSAYQRGQQFTVLHLVSNVNNQVVGRDKRRLKVTVTGENVPSISKWFDVYFDQEGYFVCEME